MTTRSFVAALLIVMAPIGCNEHTTLPTAPVNPPTQAVPPPPPPPINDEVWITGSVYDASRNCLNGAEVAVVDDTTPGSHAVNDCTFNPTPPLGRYLIKGMREGATVTLRVTLAGYRTEERQITLHGDLEGWVQADIVLQKL